MASSSSHVMAGAIASLGYIDAIDFNDLETSKLIAQLALDDIVQINGGRKGKARADLPLSDEEVAFNMQCSYWEGVIRTIDDHLFAQSINNAMDSDQVYIEVLAAVERAASDDHDAAVALSNGLPLPVTSQAQRSMEVKAFFEPLEEKPVAVSVPTGKTSARFGDQHQAAGPSYSTSNADMEDQGKEIEEIENSVREITIDDPLEKDKGLSMLSLKRTRAQCIICGELIRGARLHNSCNHDYCVDCVISLVDACTKDETLYPPRCCHQPFNYDDIVPLLNTRLRATFDTKKTELDIPPENRVYCPTPTCSRFLGSTGVMEKITCHSCYAIVCLQCRQEDHPGDSCSENVGTRALRELAQTEHWQTCPQCKAIVELNQGCYHITCRCRAQFCYLCGETWRTCMCPQWDEAHIIYTAQQRLQQDIGTARIDEQAYLQRFNEMVNVLRSNHDCDNHRWKSRGGPSQCEECNDVMPVYILVCQNCRLRACKRCARNRL